MPSDFITFFHTATRHAPYTYQCRLACGPRRDREDASTWLSHGAACRSLLIDIPTGLGKTAAVVLAWLWNRVIMNSNNDQPSTVRRWPRRLVYCLPMRTLVEQTRDEARGWINNLANAFPENGELKRLSEHSPVILMGGEDSGEWDIYPERPTILIGTQDMLLSRALNRGYGMSRYRWPIHFGLLNNDCLWVMDETQLMGPGLWTSSQLDWMRQDRFPVMLPCVTWWMSATISPEFLDTIDRRDSNFPAAEAFTLGEEPRAVELLNARRPCHLWHVASRPRGRISKTTAQQNDPERVYALALAEAIIAEHTPGTLTLVVCNTVRFAQMLFEAVNQRRGESGDVILLTSRFRAADREINSGKLIAFERARKRGETHHGLICISTQVVEAGVDVSARRLWSEVAPWPSVLQRLGRVNRDGQINSEALALFFEVATSDNSRRRMPRSAGPYEPKDVADGKKLITRLAEISSEQPEISFRDMLAQLARGSAAASLLSETLRPKPDPFPRAMDMHGLFTNEPDAFGGFTDISRFVRGEDKNADATVFWRKWKPETDYLSDLDGPVFSREEGCPVAIHRVREFLGEKGRCWLWNSKNESWEVARKDDLVPGMLIMLPVSAGGYDRRLGWTGRKIDNAGLEDAPPPGPAEERASDDQAIGCWVDLDTHLADVEKAAEDVVEVFDYESPYRNAILSAARYHDIGKSIGQWQRALPQPSPKDNVLWAKAPFLLRLEPKPRETPSRTAIEDILRAAAIPFSWTSAEQPWRKREKTPDDLHFHLGRKTSVQTAEELSGVAGVSKAVIARFRPGLRHEAASALALWHRFYYEGSADFPSLTLYLVAAHHGIVRTSLGSREQEQPNVCGIPLNVGQIPWAGGMPLNFECASDGAAGDFSEDGSTFSFRAPGWSGLVTDLLGGWEKDAPRAPSGAVRDGEPCHLGPFGLAYLEALLRAADGRASESPSRLITADGQTS